MNKKYIFLYFIIIIMIILSGNTYKKININRDNYNGQRIVRASEYLIIRANQDNINNYKNGNKFDMYTFNDNDITNYRYIGNEANNYIYFNCSNISDTSTCELWRIIGVFKVENSYLKNQYRIKIMKDEPINSIKWGSNNNFNDSNIKKYLNNGEFYYSLKGKAKNMIDTTKYYLGGIDNIGNGSTLYGLEHSNNTYNNYPYDFYGMIGLITPSDYSYTFAYNYDNECYNNIYSCNNNSWMKFKSSTWTMIPSSKSNTVYTVGDNSKDHNPNELLDIYPVFYLKYDTVIEGGNGSSVDPYIIRALSTSDIQNESDLVNAGDKSIIDVDDTASSLSIALLVISFTVIGSGIVIFMISFVKSRRELR